MSQSFLSKSVNRPSRARKVRQGDVARAVKAAQKANLPIAAVRIEPDGAIVIIHGAPQPPAPPAPAINVWDE
jgi:hypothetical protein